MTLHLVIEGLTFHTHTYPSKCAGPYQIPFFYQVPCHNLFHLLSDDWQSFQNNIVQQEGILLIHVMETLVHPLFRHQNYQLVSQSAWLIMIKRMEMEFMMMMILEMVIMMTMVMKEEDVTTALGQTGCCIYSPLS